MAGRIFRRPTNHLKCRRWMLLSQHTHLPRNSHVNYNIVSQGNSSEATPKVPPAIVAGSGASLIVLASKGEGMIKIRLRRTGATKQPHYRIVVADARAPRDGKYIDLVGHYNPLTEPATIDVDAEKAARWVQQGAQMTETVQKLFARAGVLDQVRGASK